MGHCIRCRYCLLNGRNKINYLHCVHHYHEISSYKIHTYHRWFSEVHPHRYSLSKNVGNSWALEHSNSLWLRVGVYVWESETERIYLLDTIWQWHQQQIHVRKTPVNGDCCSVLFRRLKVKQNMCKFIILRRIKKLKIVWRHLKIQGCISIHQYNFNIALAVTFQ